jgi:hypothetical protein
MAPVSPYLLLAKNTVIEALRRQPEGFSRRIRSPCAGAPPAIARLRGSFGTTSALIALFSVITNEPLNCRKFKPKLVARYIQTVLTFSNPIYREIRTLLRLTITKLLPHCQPTQ